MHLTCGYIVLAYPSVAPGPAFMPNRERRMENGRT